MPATGRTLRTDARANRDSILVAAAEEFASRGLDATFEDIAHAAGVGRATLYRHFPTREQLLGALFARAIDEIELRSLDRPNDVDALEHVLRTTVQVLVDHLPVIGPLRAHGPLDDDLVEPLRARMAQLMTAPLAEAKASGRAREDLAVEDLNVLVAMLASVVRPGVSFEDTERALHLADAAIGRR